MTLFHNNFHVTLLSFSHILHHPSFPLPLPFLPRPSSYSLLPSSFFVQVCQIMQSGTAVGARHKDHAVTGSVDKGLSNALTLYFFGPDKSGKLTVEQFEQFRDDLTEACLWIEVGGLACVCNVMYCGT